MTKKEEFAEKLLEFVPKHIVDRAEKVAQKWEFSLSAMDHGSADAVSSDL